LGRVKGERNGEPSFGGRCSHTCGLGSVLVLRAGSTPGRSRARFVAYGFAALAPVCLLVSTAAARDAAAPSAAFIREARVLESDETGVSAPVGLAAFSPKSVLYVVEPSGGQATEVVNLNRFGRGKGSARIAAAVRDPINMSFDTAHDRLLLLGSADQLLEVHADANGELDPRTLNRRDARHLDLKDPQGMAVDPASGVLYVLDASGPRIVRVAPDANGSFEGGTVSEVDLRGSGLENLRGLALDPSTGHLHVRSGQQLFELTVTGEVAAVRDLASLQLSDPQGMVFAPSGDQTDDPAQLSLYVADSPTRTARQAAPSAASGSGQIVEASFAELTASASSDFSSSLVRTVDTAAFSPPSPDPSGLTYLPAPANKLVMTDGEVEETVTGITHFQGASLWELRLDGTVLRSANLSKIAPTTVSMTNEPTGIAWNPGNGHYYVTDDDAQRVYDLNPGADGLPGTTDDSFTFFSTIGAGSGDPEGITFDTANNHIFVSDGVNAEIYEFTISGTSVAHFDVAQQHPVRPEQYREPNHRRDLAEWSPSAHDRLLILGRVRSRGARLRSRQRWLRCEALLCRRSRDRQQRQPQHRRREDVRADGSDEFRATEFSALCQRRPRPDGHAARSRQSRRHRRRRWPA
jgi:uncharacterized protein YjiK